MQPPLETTDNQIHTDVLEELDWDARVKHGDLGVRVERGLVTLTGSVASWAEKVAAQEAAHRVAGVLDVANDLEVQRASAALHPDTAIAKAVRVALSSNVLVPHERIRTTASDGVVTLEGTVDRWAEYDDAARTVRYVQGVREVINRIEVDARAIAPDVVRRSIEAALKRHVMRAAQHVRIEVTDGRVTLSGAVPSWVERKAVVGAVMGTPGVRAIEDRLNIRVVA